MKRGVRCTLSLIRIGAYQHLIALSNSERTRASGYIHRCRIHVRGRCLKAESGDGDSSQFRHASCSLRRGEPCLHKVILLVFLSDLRSSLGSFISRIPSFILADTFSVSMLSAKPMFLRNVEKALSLCK